MSAEPVKVAVVGHTNTGKTSLLRTLTRDIGFGEVSDHPAVTRHVEGAELLIDGEPVLDLYDTPGLEDSIGLLEHLDERGRRATGGGGYGRPDWRLVLDEFLVSEDAQGRFAQEAKALRQVLKSDIGLYVIDARDRVLGKHRDELEILGRCARPVVPVLNFTADEHARTEEWRDHLSQVNMHAVAAFDTVVLDEDGERHLFETMQTLLDRRRELFRRLIADRERQRRRLVRAAGRLLADLLIDVAACVLIVPGDGGPEAAEAIATMKTAVREREQRCVEQLMALFRFRPEDGRLLDMPMANGRWGLDLFTPAALRQFGVKAGGAAAAGAMAGLALDAMTGGITFGLFTASGAALGTLWQTGRAYGRRLVDRARGRHELRCDDSTLRLLLRRQMTLVAALLHRGHAAMEPVVVGEERGGRAGRGGGLTMIRRIAARFEQEQKLPEALARARVNPRWSSLLGREGEVETGDGAIGRGVVEPARAAAETDLAEWIERELTAG